MGQGGFLWIINATSKVLKVANSRSYQMSSWKFSDIPSQSQTRFYIEYHSTTTDTSGEATFQLEGTSSSFELLTYHPKKDGECGLKVDWCGITTNDYQIFPPAFQDEEFGKLGWIHNGSLSLLILEKGVKTSVSTSLPDNDLITSPKPIENPQTALHGSWMEHYSDLIGKLTMTEMTLPGTHDSGTHQPAFYLGTPWIKTQELSLKEQLNGGIRVLDLRIGQSSPGNYFICHATWKTSYSLGGALKEVRDFIDSSIKEIVILDFHRFVDFGGESYDYTQLKQQIGAALHDYCLAPSHLDSTLETIWSATSQKERLVIAWNEPNPDAYMWPGVNQRWHKDADSLSKLYQSIKDDTLCPPVGMWSACCFKKSDLIATPYCNAVDASPTLANWYFGGSDFCEKANIVSVDFFNKFTTIVQASIVSNLLKAGKKEH